MKLIESFFPGLQYARFFIQMAFEKVNTFIVSNLFKLDTINESETNSIMEIFDSRGELNDICNNNGNNRQTFIILI